MVSLLPLATTPLTDLAFLESTSFQPTMSPTKVLTGEFIDGFASRSIAALKLCAVTVAPSLNLIPGRIVNVYDLPLGEMTGIPAAAAGLSYVLPPPTSE